MPVKAYNTRVLVDGFDFSGDTKGVTVALTVDKIDASSLQSSAAKAIAGNVDGSIELSGYWGGAVGLIDNEVYSRLGSGTDALVSVLLDTTAVGNPAYVQRTTWGQQMKVDGPIDGLLTLDSTWQDNTDRGLSVAHQTINATGALTGIDFAVAGTVGGWAALHVRSITGTAANATITVQSSTVVGFTSPVTHGTFTFSSGGANGYTLVFTGAVGRYVRVNCTSLGGATSFDVTAIVGVYGVTG